MLSKLRGFRFVTTLILEFKNKKIENDDETKLTTYSNSKQKQLLMKEMLVIYLNQFILQLYPTYKISLLCFEGKISIQNNRYDGLAHGYQSCLLKNLYCQAYFNFF